MARSILVVDDEPAFLGLVARILSDLGIDSVATAQDASEALRVAQEMQPDAVLVDVGLHDRGGIDLANQLSGLPSGPRVVLTSSDGDAFQAIEPRSGDRELPFIAKEELDMNTLREILLDE